MAESNTHFIVFANEKGGSGKSTSAVHTAVALAAAGRRVATLDMDTRQRTLARYLENRQATMRRLNVDLPMPVFDTFDPAKGVPIDERPTSSSSIRRDGTIRMRAPRSSGPIRW
jgi:chromosome partitioning protein